MSLAPILQAPPAIQIHLLAALLALAFGTVIWLRPKGTYSHKITGRGFILLMLIATISAVFIRENGGKLSGIHIFVPITFALIALSLWHIRKGNIKKHVSAVKGLFFGALILPGIFTFVPGRRLFQIFFDN